MGIITAETVTATLAEKNNLALVTIAKIQAIRSSIARQTLFLDALASAHINGDFEEARNYAYNLGDAGSSLYSRVTAVRDAMADEMEAVGVVVEKDAF